MQKKEYQPLTVPRLEWDAKTLTNVSGELVVEPLDPGFGYTLGNALRRVLLGLIEGSAVTSVVIRGTNNEFSSLPGLEEDVMQICLNIKQIIVCNKTGKRGIMKLVVKGPATVTVGDIHADDHLELLNKDLVLAHVAADGVLDIEFTVEAGRGYRPAQWPLERGLQIDGGIYLDAMFSPVRNVTFDVEKTRVGRNIDFDKLKLVIQTDGTVSPTEVLHYAVSVLRTQLEYFLSVPEIMFNESAHGATTNAKDDDLIAELSARGISSDLLLKPIDALEFSVRAHNCLINAGIKRIVDLVNLSEEEVRKIKNFGAKSLEEVKSGMKAFGLTFGMGIKEESLREILKAD